MVHKSLTLFFFFFFKLVGRYNKKTEISKRKTTINTLNAQQQPFWPHLYGENPWTVPFQLPLFTKSQRRFLMGQILEWKFRWLTSVRSRWFKRKLYNVKDPPIWGGSKNIMKEKRKWITVVLRVVLAFINSDLNNSSFPRTTISSSFTCIFVFVYILNPC